MTQMRQARRSLITAGAVTLGAALATRGFGLRAPLQAQGLAPTPTMRGGANNYLPGAPIVPRIGSGGFWLTGTVRRAGDGAPLQGIRLQMWAHTTEGHERDPHSHGATLTDGNGVFRMEMPQIVPAFGQAHAHVAYDAAQDAGGFATVFLRPLLRSSGDKSLAVDFVLQKA